MESFLKIIIAVCGIAIMRPLYAKTIHIPLYSKTISLDPTGMQDQSSLWVSRHVNCQLVRLKGGQTVLDAASDVSFKSPTEIEITLKQDAVFQDGTALEAEDVIASLNFIENSRKVLRNIFQWIDHYKIISKKKILISLKSPIPHFLKTLSGPNYAIFKKEFLDRARKDSSLWKTPLGCGNYVIQKYVNEEYVSLHSLKNEPEIVFHFLSQNQLTSEEANAFDIIGVPIIGNKNLNNFKKISIFDPYQIFIGLNTQLPKWQNQQNRCNLLSQFNREPILKKYGDTGRAANDFFPQGVIGYNGTTDFQNYYKKRRTSVTIPKNFCVSLVTASIPEAYRDAFLEILPFDKTKIERQFIQNPKTFADTFQHQKCDALAIGLKTNYLDGYEYLLIFAENHANFTGYKNRDLTDKIKNTQNIEDVTQRSFIYQQIVSTIQQECLVYPLVTVPMKRIFVKKNIGHIDIGKGPLNEYYLGDIK